MISTLPLIDSENERYLLACATIGFPESVEKVQFGDTTHKALADLIRKSKLPGTADDMMTVLGAIRGHQMEPSFRPILNDLVTLANQPTPETIENSKRIVNELSDRRLIRSAGNKLIEAAEGNGDMHTIVKNLPDLLKAGIGEARPSVKQLTSRTVSEIMAYKADENDLILADGYLCKGARTVWLGQGGLGKSRLSLQLAFSCCTGRDFLEIETRGRGLRWLFLQTENGNRRLQYDLSHMRKGYTADEWKRIDQSVSFHTLESDEDGVILLDEERHFARAAELILSVKADVIVIDPLRDSHSGDLNGDAEMTQATRNLTRLQKVGGQSDRALLVLHHALTGKAGAGKATGYDRSSFGRNSKVLQGWTRAQVNIAPGGAENCSVLVMASGKNNDFPEFSPYAIELNPETMSYEIKGDFDLEKWQDEMAGVKRGQKQAGPAEIISLIEKSGGRIEKKDLIRQAMADTGRGDNFVRRIITVMVEDGEVIETKEPRPNKPAAVFIELPIDQEGQDDD